VKKLPEILAVTVKAALHRQGVGSLLGRCEVTTACVNIKKRMNN